MKLSEVDCVLELDLAGVDAVWVEDTDEFETICQSFLQAEWLALDTEFERRTTYYPIFALLQIYDGNQVYLIDPQKVDCPAVFRSIMADAEIIKLLHAGKEDLEVFLHHWQCRIAGLFDTQVANAFASGELSLGYAGLVKKCCQVELDKQETQSDWLARPLSNNQLTYAAYDVIYLPQIYEALKPQMLNQSYYEFFQAECQLLAQQAEGAIAEYRQAKDVCRLNGEQLALFRRLFEWREEVARAENRTKNHLMRDQQLVEIAIVKPTSMGHLKSIEGIHPRSVRKYSEPICRLVKDFIATPAQALPVVRNPRDLENLKALSSALDKATADIASQIGLVPGIIASKRVLKKVAFAHLTGEAPPVNWQSWRKRILEPVFAPILTQFNPSN